MFLITKSASEIGLKLRGSSLISLELNRNLFFLFVLLTLLEIWPKKSEESWRRLFKIQAIPKIAFKDSSARYMELTIFF